MTTKFEWRFVGNSNLKHNQSSTINVTNDTAAPSELSFAKFSLLQYPKSKILKISTEFKGFY